MTSNWDAFQFSPFARAVSRFAWDSSHRSLAGHPTCPARMQQQPNGGQGREQCTQSPQVRGAVPRPSHSHGTAFWAPQLWSGHLWLGPGWGRQPWRACLATLNRRDSSRSCSGFSEEAACCLTGVFVGALLREACIFWWKGISERFYCQFGLMSSCSTSLQVQERETCPLKSVCLISKVCYCLVFLAHLCSLNEVEREVSRRAFVLTISRAWKHLKIWDI